MVETVKALRDEIKAELKDIRQESAAALTELRTANADQFSELRTKIDANADGLAHVQGLIKGWSLVAAVGAIVVTIVGAFGAKEFFADRAHLRELVEKQETLYQTSTLLTQSNLIDRLETEFERGPSLDALRERPDVRREVQRLAEALERLAPTIKDATARSTFYLVGKALEPFLTNDCVSVLKLLGDVQLNDRSRFIYAYMRAACLLRTGDYKTADEALGVAATLTQARKASMVTNAQAVAKLYQSRVAKDVKVVDDAIAVLASLIERDPNFFDARMNLAAAYAEKKDFAAASRELRTICQLKAGSPDDVARGIKEDLERPSDRFFEQYVRIELKVVLPTADPSWATRLKESLGL